VRGWLLDSRVDLARSTRPGQTLPARPSGVYGPPIQRNGFTDLVLKDDMLLDINAPDFGQSADMNQTPCGR